MDLFPRTGELGLDAADAGLFAASLLVAGAVVHLLHATDVLQAAPGMFLGAAVLKARRVLAQRRLRMVEAAK